MGMFDEYFDNLDKQRAGQAGASALSSDRTPDAAAEQRQIGRDMNLPTVVVGTDPDFYRDILARKKMTTALAGAPKTATWMQDPVNADLAKDDVANLTAWESARNSLTRGGYRGAQTYEQYNAFQARQQASDRDKSFGQMVYEEQPKIYGPDGSVVDVATPGPLSAINATSRYISSRVGSWLGVDDDTAVQAQVAAAQWAERASQVPMSKGAAAVRDKIGGLKPSGSWLEDLKQYGAVIGEDPAGFISFMAQVGGESLPTIAVASVAGAVTRNPAVAAVAMGATSGAQELGTAPLEVLQESGHDLTTPEGAAAALADEALVRRAQERGEIRGLIIGALDGLSGGIAGKMLARSEVGNMVLQGLAQAGLGGGGEALAQYASGQEINIAEVLTEGLAEFVTAPVEVAAIGQRKFTGAVSRFTRSGETTRHVEKIDGMAAESKLKQRAPDAFLDALNHQGLGDNELLIPSDQVNEYFQSQGVTIDDEILQAWGIIPEAWETALASGADVAIPVSNYAANISGTDAAAFIRDNAVFDPDEMSSAEARAFNDAWRDAMEQEIAEVEAQRRADDQMRADEEIIGDEVRGALMDSGLTPDAARFSAAPVTSFITTMADRIGFTPLDLWRRYGVSIQGEMQAQFVRRRNAVDSAVNEIRGLGRKPGATKAEAVKAAEKAAVEQFPELKLKRPFTERIKGMGGIEPGSPAAIELGHLGVTPKAAPGLFKSGGATDLDNIVASEVFSSPVLKEDGNGYLDRDSVFEALAREAKGEKVAYSAEANEALTALQSTQGAEDVAAPATYAGNFAAGTEAARVAALMDQLGLDADTMTNDQIAAALGEADMRATSAAVDGMTYNQGDTPLGSLAVTKDGIAKGGAVIRLFEGSNLSTFLHESGHLFLEIYKDVAALDGTPQQIKDDYQAIRDWMGVKPGADIERKHHEKWARGFEAYLMEGRAPSLELQDAFSRFRSWLGRIYQTVKNLNVKVSPQIRDVMDRMLASDEAIAEARSVQDVGPLFAERGPSGMSESDWSAYKRLAERSKTSAEDALRAKMMDTIRREKTAEWKANRQDMAKAVEADFAGRRNFQLVSALADGRWLRDTTAEVPDIRIDVDALTEIAGAGILQEIDRKRVGGRRNIFGKGGEHPQSVAEMFGYSSVKEMLEELQNTPPYRRALAEEIDRRMIEQYGDVLHDGTIEAEAEAALHNKAQADQDVAELRAMGRQLAAAGRAPAKRQGDLRARVFKARAKSMIGAMSVRDASRPNTFMRAERKAAAEAQQAFASVVRGEGGGPVGLKSVEALQKAYDAKERQVLNHHLYLEAKALAEDLQKGRKLFRSYSSPRVRQSIGSPHIERIDDLLATYDFKARSDKWLSNREAMRQYIDEMTAQGRENELSIDPAIASEDGRNHYSRMSADEFRGLVDSVKNIENIGRRTGKLRDARRTRDLDETLKAVRDEMKKNWTRRPRGRAGATKADQRRKLGRDMMNWTLNADTLLREIDGREALGPAWSAMKEDIDLGLAKLTQRKVTVAEDFDKLFSVYSDAEKRDMTVRRPNKILGDDFSKFNLISIALNTGNRDNWQRLTNPKVKGYIREDVANAALAELDERDWRFVQSIWDYVNSYWGEISAKETRVSGVSPTKVEAEVMSGAAPAFVTGGYYPIKYDNGINARADDLTQAQAADQLRGGRLSKAQTAKGHTKERLTTSTQPISLDIGHAFAHVSDVIYDLELNEPIVNTWQILSKLKQDFYDAGKHSDYDALESWVKDVAAGERSVAHGWGKAMQVGRTGFTFSRLALNLGTVLLQPTGIAQSFVVVGKAQMARGMAKFLSNPVRWGSDIAAASPFMAERQRTFQRDLHNIMGDLDTSGMTGGRWAKFQRDFMAPLAFYLMQKVQYYTVDAPTWLAAYDDGVKKGWAEDRARTYADLMVKRAQGSGLLSDRGMLERGKFTPTQEMNELPKMLTTLGSYMFAKFNAAYERTAGVKWKSPVEVMSWAADMALLFAFEATLTAVVKSELWDDDEAWWTWLAKETGLQVMGTMPFVRDVASGLQGFSSGGAAQSVLDIGVARPAMEALDVVSKGEFDRKTVTTAIDAFGVWMHLPSAQTNRTIKAFFDEELNPQTPTFFGALGVGQGKGRSLAEVMFGG